MGPINCALNPGMPVQNTEHQKKRPQMCLNYTYTEGL